MPVEHRQISSTDFFKTTFGKIKTKLAASNVIIHANNISNETEISIWNNSVIEPHTTFFWHRRMCTMGAFSYIHANPFNGLQIGRYCSIASDIRLFGAHHYPEWVSTSSRFYAQCYIDCNKPLSYEERTFNSTVIENDVWIGSHVALDRNIKIGNGAIIATGAVVTKDVVPFSIVGGVPARTIKMRFSDKIIEKILELQWWDYNLIDFRGMKIDRPEYFLNMLEENINNGSMLKYKPSPLCVRDLCRDINL